MDEFDIEGVICNQRNIKGAILFCNDIDACFSLQ